METRHLVTLLIFSAVAFFMAFRYPLGSSSLEWKEWNEAYVEAKKTNKPLLIDAYTEWCGWCKRMDTDTYGKEQVISYINKHFVPVKFNPELKQTYQVGETEMSGRELLANLSGGQGVGYPTTFFLSLEKNQVTMVQGYHGPADFMSILEEKVRWAQGK